jgi:hypothetical protein
MGTLTWPSKSSLSFAQAGEHTLSEARRLNRYAISSNQQTVDQLFASARALDGDREGFERAWNSYPARVDARFKALAGAQPAPKNISLVYTPSHLKVQAATILADIKRLADLRSDLRYVQDLARHEADADYLPPDIAYLVKSLVGARQTMREIMAAVASRIETSLVEAASNKTLKARAYNAQMQGVYAAWDATDSRLRAGGATGADFTGIHGEPSTYDRIQARFDRLVQGIQTLNDETSRLKRAAQALVIAVSSMEQGTLDGLLAAATQSQVIDV